MTLLEDTSPWVSHASAHHAEEASTSLLFQTTFSSILLYYRALEDQDSVSFWSTTLEEVVLSEIQACFLSSIKLSNFPSSEFLSQVCFKSICGWHPRKPLQMPPWGGGREKLIHMCNSQCAVSSNKVLCITIKLGESPLDHSHFLYQTQSSGAPKTTLSFDNLLEIFMELTESSYTHHYGFPQQNNLQIKVSKGKRHMGQHPPKFQRLSFKCPPPAGSYAYALLPVLVCSELREAHLSLDVQSLY